MFFHNLQIVPLHSIHLFACRLSHAGPVDKCTVEFNNSQTEILQNYRTKEEK